MTFEDGLKSFLRSSPYALAVETRVYSHAAPQGVSEPYLVIYRIAPTPRMSHRGAPDLMTWLYQFSIFGRSQSQVLNIADSLRRLVNGYAGTMGSYTVSSVQWAGERPGFNATTKLHQVAADYSITYNDTPVDGMQWDSAPGQWDQMGGTFDFPVAP